MKKAAQFPTENLACFIILAEIEGVGIEKRHVCFVIAAEVLVLCGVVGGMQTSRMLEVVQSLQTELVKKQFGNS